MDSYTKKVNDWLNDRFSSTDENGVFVAHQPIYGFRKQPSEPGHVGRYIITYRLLDALRHFSFDSLLDVGGAEGYKAYLVKKFFNVQVMSTDLSEEACNRTRELFDIIATPVDIHDMPFEDNQFDIITCSETLEHVTDWKLAISELLRVAKKAVIITVPHDPVEAIKRNVDNNELHAHIHHFDQYSFDYLTEKGYGVVANKMSNALLVIPSCLVDAQIRDHSAQWIHPKIFTQLYNFLSILTRRVFGRRSAMAIVRLDSYFCSILSNHKANLFFIIKDQTAFSLKAIHRRISLAELIDFAVPLYYLRKH